MLFIIDIDALSRLFNHAASLVVLEQLHCRRAMTGVSLYAGDLVLFCCPFIQDLTAIPDILALFREASGLRMSASITPRAQRRRSIAPLMRRPWCPPFLINGRKLFY
jgi:hypothetical protein